MAEMTSSSSNVVTRSQSTTLFTQAIKDIGKQVDDLNARKRALFAAMSEGGEPSSVINHRVDFDTRCDNVLLTCKG